ncbi:MAG: ABC transporter ATP-binding protein [Spirochaetaceae bacterium]
MSIVAELNEIRVENVNFRYKDDLVIKNAHFHIEKGSFICFVGPNGGGKSTLAKLILGLLKPSKGYITIFGQTPLKARGDVGYVPQYSNFDLDFPINVMDVVLMGRLKKGRLFYTAKDKSAALNALKDVDLVGFEKRHFSELSGGQRQRVLIARAVVSNPKVLILDEPTSNIDKITENRLYELLFRFNESMTIILISHDLTFVTENVQKVICVNKEVKIHPTGKIEIESMDTLFGRPVKIVNHQTKMEDLHE